MMCVSEQGLALIRQFEGFSTIPYICPAGKETIGFGHVIKAEEWFAAEGISQEQANILLKQDVSVAERAIRRFVTTAVTQGQFDALASFIYNIGSKAFEKSTLLRYLNTGKPDAAASEFGRWVYAGGRKIPGLIRRRAAESLLFSSDI